MSKDAIVIGNASRRLAVWKILAEREAQLEKWGAAHDEHHTMLEWTGLLGSYVAGVYGTTPRTALVKTAALCIAILEVLDKNVERLTYEEELAFRGKVDAGDTRMRLIWAKLRRLRAKGAAVKEEVTAARSKPITPGELLDPNGPGISDLGKRVRITRSSPSSYEGRVGVLVAIPVSTSVQFRVALGTFCDGVEDYWYADEVELVNV